MTAQPKPDLGNPGASARREVERRRKAHESRRSAGLIATLRRPRGARKAPDKSWATGAEGEEMVAESLARRCPDVLVLHDRRMRGSRTNIDHIAVAPSGVYVIDAKRYRGKVEVIRSRGGKSQLRIAGRDRSKLVGGLAKQVMAVEAAVAGLMPEVRVRGCLCFVAPEGLLAESGIPLLRMLRIDGFPLFYPRKLAKQLNKRGPLSREQVRLLAEELARRFAPA